MESKSRRASRWTPFTCVGVVGIVCLTLGWVAVALQSTWHVGDLDQRLAALEGGGGGGNREKETAGFLQVRGQELERLQQREDALERTVSDLKNQLHAMKSHLQEGHAQTPTGAGVLHLPAGIAPAVDVPAAAESVQTDGHAAAAAAREEVSSEPIASALEEPASGSFKRGPQNARQTFIRDMMVHSWNEGYVKYCWGKDEFHPVSRSCHSGWKLGLTLVDTLDTLHIMGMDAEFKAGRDWVADPTSLDYTHVGNVNLFETTIRVLGGLLGAHAMSGDAVFMEKAKLLGDRLLPGVHGLRNVPYSDIDIRSGQGQFLGGDASTAEATSLGLEFRTLSQITSDAKYREAEDVVAKTFHNMPKNRGLLQNRVDPHNGRPTGGTYSLGSRGDSYYEYLIKNYLLMGKRGQAATDALEDWKASVDGMQSLLLKTSQGSQKLTYLAEITGTGMYDKMDHLVCFLPGTLGLGVTYAGLPKAHLELAEKLIETCIAMYESNGKWLGPEIAHFNMDGQELFVKPADAHDILRPETVESLFYLYRFTKNKKYQEWGWKIAQAFEQHTKVTSGGYTSLDSVFTTSRGRDKMESFFCAETLKYLFLLFDDSMTQVPLDRYVFNTEAHPLRIFGA